MDGVTGSVNTSAARAAAETPAAVHVRGGRGYVSQVVELVRQVAEAAHALHERGIIHREVKPGDEGPCSAGSGPSIASPACCC